MFLNLHVRRILFVLLPLITTNIISAQVLQDTQRVIFPKETRVEIDIISDTSFLRFTPVAADLDSTDKYLNENFLNKNIQLNKTQVLGDYFRQYFGLWLKGKKYIFVNASCFKPDYFLVNTFSYKGGGKCFFRALVAIDDKQVDILYFNAPK